MDEYFMFTVSRKKVWVDLTDKPIVEAFSWWLNKKNYVCASKVIDTVRTVTLLHREIMQAKKGEVVDHKNRNVRDNRRCNLRLCSNAQNLARREVNRPKFKGVQAWRRKFRALISCNGKATHLGVFSTAEEAARAYNEAALRQYGEFATLNKL